MFCAAFAFAGTRHLVPLVRPTREPIVCFPQIDAGRQVPSKNCESGIFASVALWQWNLSCRVLAVKLALRDCFWTHPILRNSGTLDLDVGTGRRLPDRAHSLVRDGGDAPAVIDGGENAGLDPTASDG